MRHEAGSLPKALRRFRSAAEFRAASPLPLHAEELIDAEVISVGVERLAVARAILAHGLVRPLPNWLAVPRLTQQTKSKSGSVRRTMKMQSRRDLSRQDYGSFITPIYATIGEFEIDVRELMEAQRAGFDLDVSEVSEITRRINESIEDATIFGWTDEAGTLVKVAGSTQPGLLGAPNVNSRQFAGGGAGKAWDDVTKTGTDIFNDVQALVGDLQADFMFGPYTLFVGTAYNTVLDSDFKPNSDLTIRQRLQQIEAGGKSLEIVAADRMTSTKVALVQMTTDVVDMVVGEEPTAISWGDEPGWEFNSAVVACMVPRWKSNYDGGSGVAIGHT